MSMSYWGIDGYGLCLDDIYNHVNNQKVIARLKQMFKPDQTEDIDPQEDILDADWFYGDPYSNFAEFLCEAYDDKKILTWEDDGNSRAFLLYCPPYPWNLKPQDPKSMQELIDYMADVLKNVVDLPIDEIKEKFDYISDYGCG